jgi:RHS repeat-associated protein
VSAAIALVSPRRIKASHRRRRKVASSRQHYNYQRDYDPSVGRYTQSDPIGLAGGISTYAYAGSMPTGAIDPMGLAHGYFDWGDVFFGSIVAASDMIGFDPTLPQGLVDFTFGFLDGASFGLSKLTRNLTGGSGAVNECSDYYSAGGWGAVAFDLLTGGTLIKGGLRALKTAKSVLPKIRGNTKFLRNPAQIDKIKADMLSGNYRFNSPEGVISGVVDSKGVVHLTEGQHRMNAALEIFEQTGNPNFVNNLLSAARNGVNGRSFLIPGKAPVGSIPLPRR